MITNVITKAFSKEPFSDGTESELVKRLRLSDNYIPELELVALLSETIVGHILLTQIHIQGNDMAHPALALAPVSVLPAFQSQRIGSQLIIKAHNIASSLDYDIVALIGHEDYYPRFGYERADTYNITFPFPVPPQNCMVKALSENALDGISGEVVYPPPFLD